MRPWKYPNRMEIGRKIRSDGSRTNRPINLTTLLTNIKIHCASMAYLAYSAEQDSVALRVRKIIKGSKAKDNEVKVAICKAYVDQGCWLGKS